VDVKFTLIQLKKHLFFIVRACLALPFSAETAADHLVFLTRINAGEKPPF
jgi:hypothetical protein